MAFVAARYMYKVHEHGLHTRSGRVVNDHTISVLGVANSVTHMRIYAGATLTLTRCMPGAFELTISVSLRISAVSFACHISDCLQYKE